MESQSNQASTHFFTYGLMANGLGDSFDSDDSLDSDDSFGGDEWVHSGGEMSASGSLHATEPAAGNPLSHWQAWDYVREREMERARLLVVDAWPGDSFFQFSPHGERLLDDLILHLTDSLRSLGSDEDSDEDGGSDDDEAIFPIFARSPRPMFPIVVQLPRPIYEDYDIDDEELPDSDLIFSTVSIIHDEDYTGPLIDTHQSHDDSDDETMFPDVARSPRPILEDQDTDDEELMDHDLVRSTGSIVDDDYDNDAAPLLSTRPDRLDSVNETDDLEVGNLGDGSHDDRRRSRLSGQTWIPANGCFSAEYRNAAQQRAREQGYPTVSEVPDGGPIALCIRETHVDLFLVVTPRDDEAAAAAGDDDDDDDKGSLESSYSSYQSAEQEIYDDWREDRLALAEIGYTTRVASSLGLAVRLALSGLGCGVLFLALYFCFCCVVYGLEKLYIWALVVFSGPVAQCGMLACLLVVIL